MEGEGGNRWQRGIWKRGGAEGEEVGLGPPRRRVNLEFVRAGGDMPPQEEGVDLPEISPTRAYLLLQGVHGDFPHHHDGSHLDGGFPYNNIIQRLCHWLAAQLVSWYAIPSVAVGTGSRK